MIIILEGCDGVGKTTFAEKLSEETGFKVVKGSSFEIAELGTLKMFKYMNGILDIDNIIIDRFLYSNIVYGKLFNYPMMTDSQYRTLIKKMSKNSLLVYLHADRDEIAKRLSNRGDDMIKIGNIGDIIEGYNDALYNGYKPSSMLSIDTTNCGFSTMSSFIGKIAL